MADPHSRSTPPRPSVDNDVADPTGGTLIDHVTTARELDELVARLVTLVWPVADVAQGDR